MNFDKKEKERRAKEVYNEILFRIRELFSSHKRKVEQYNEEGSYNGRDSRNEKFAGFYNEMNSSVQDLSKAHFI